MILRTESLNSAGGIRQKSFIPKSMTTRSGFNALTYEETYFAPHSTVEPGNPALYPRTKARGYFHRNPSQSRSKYAGIYGFTPSYPLTLNPRVILIPYATTVTRAPA